MKAITQVLADEEASRADYEATTEYKGYKIAFLRQVFDAVADPKDWKRPWAAFVPHQVVGALGVAVEFFHADRMEIGGIQPITGRVAVMGNGYQAY